MVGHTGVLHTGFRYAFVLLNLLIVPAAMPATARADPALRAARRPRRLRIRRCRDSLEVVGKVLLVRGARNGRQDALLRLRCQRRWLCKGRSHQPCPSLAAALIRADSLGCISFQAFEVSTPTCLMRSPQLLAHRGIELAPAGVVQLHHAGFAGANREGQ
jgi:hypothetical protein